LCLVNLINPKNPKALDARQSLAIALIEQKQYVQAIEHLNQAISIDSSSPVTHLYAGIALPSLDQKKERLRGAAPLRYG